MELPIIIINLKAYKEGLGDRALRLCKYAYEVYREYGVDIKIAVNPIDIRSCLREYPDVVISQNVDAIDYGAHTGHIPLTYLFDLGVESSLINHSEYKVPHDTISEINKKARNMGFRLVVCADSIDEMERLYELGVEPFAYAIEPPELIGTGRAVSRYKPELLLDSVRYGSKYGVPILCGAGIVDSNDVYEALKLGTRGVLVASGIVKARDPKGKMMEFARIITEMM
jgi:triosephosphate isomerase